MSDPTAVLLTGIDIVLFALLAAAGIGKLARLDGATYSTALARAATAFATVLTLGTTLLGTFTTTLH